jgi:hypothetical protein
VTNSLTVSGTVNAYDPKVTLYPSTGNWSSNVIIFSNGGIDTSGASCPPANVTGNAYYFSSPAPGSTCVSGSIVHSTYTMSLTSTACGNCQTVNNDAYGIWPTSAYNSGANKLTISSGQSVKLSSGTYFFHFVTFSGGGNLFVDTSSGPVQIFYDNKIQTASGCYFINTSYTPSKLLVSSISNSNKVDLQCTGNLYGYFEGATNNFEIHSGQYVYGHVTGNNVTIDSGAALHYDMGDGITYDHVETSIGSSGSWGESYKTQ